MAEINVTVKRLPAIYRGGKIYRHYNSVNDGRDVDDSYTDTEDVEQQLFG
jgi:hypothetical protein